MKGKERKKEGLGVKKLAREVRRSQGEKTSTLMDDGGAGGSRGERVEKTYSRGEAVKRKYGSDKCVALLLPLSRGGPCAR